ncbi:hypothetical protein [Anaerococcus sp. Marseille-P9784]|uniref:hypothetical protein n=1 Tax=Anaerococcus sp. Marseille-P9784 TaxID=2614127 RepID=UPI00124ADB5D|nr:hypothetical protein [Anaerococcus sp. Marseille-P9784]
MEDKKTSKAQIRASKKWNAKNPEVIKRSRYKSSTKIYIRDWANEEDLKEVEEWIKLRRENL